MRTLVVLGRDLGLELEIDDVECESLLPPELKGWAPDTSEVSNGSVAMLYSSTLPLVGASVVVLKQSTCGWGRPGRVLG